MQVITDLEKGRNDWCSRETEPYPAVSPRSCAHGQHAPGETPAHAEAVRADADH